MLLCQAQDASRDIFFWLGAIVVAGIVMALIALGLRKLLLGRDEPPVVGFTLSDLRQLHADGELTDEEFAAAKGRMLAQGRAMLDDGDAASDDSDAAFGESSANPVDDAGDGPGPSR